MGRSYIGRYSLAHTPLDTGIKFDLVSAMWPVRAVSFKTAQDQNVSLEKSFIEASIENDIEDFIY